MLGKPTNKNAHGHTTSAGMPLHAVIGEFANPAEVSHAAEQLRDEGYTRWDVFAPIPIHGIDRAMGLKPSKITFFTGLGALTGFLGALTMQGWMSAVDYLTITAGKPYFAWEQFTPIMFELSVLLASIFTLVGVFVLNGLPRHHHPLMTSENFLGVSDDKFIIAIEACEPKCEGAAHARTTLESLGGFNIEEIEEA